VDKTLEQLEAERLILLRYYQKLADLIDNICLEITEIEEEQTRILDDMERSYNEPRQDA